MNRSIFSWIIFLVLSITVGCSQNNSGNITNLPTPVTNLKVLGVGTNSVKLSWNDNSTNETGFKIELRNETSNYSLAGSTNANDTSFTVLSLQTNITYYFRVYSFNSAGNSTTYSNIVSATPFCSIQIGTQFWSCKNFDSRLYKNGDPIPQANFTDWTTLTTGAWCYYNNDSSNLSKYGRLYNWYALKDSRGLVPNGWHIATLQDWGKLGVEISNNGGKLKESGYNNWLSPNTGATNSTGFTALPGGIRGPSNSGNGFSMLGTWGWWWADYAPSCGYANLTNTSSALSVNSADDTFKSNYLSIRLVKD